MTCSGECTAIDVTTVILLLIGYPPTLFFVAVYGFMQPWFRSWWGRALFVSMTGLSALMGVNLAYRLWGWDLLSRDGWLRTAVYGFVTIGAWLSFAALCQSLVRAARNERNQT